MPELFLPSLLLIFFSLWSSVYADTGMQIKWLGESDVRETLQADAVFEDGVSFINDNFQLQRSLTLIVGADDGPLYDPQLDVIQIPYDFYRQVVVLFEEVVPDDPGIREQYAIDSMLHTLFHEFGHAVIDLPVCC